MTERPILFSAPMVRALLEGRKTQTRRVLYTLRTVHAGAIPESATVFLRDYPPSLNHGLDQVDCLGRWHAIKPGELLWVRETFCYKQNFPGELGAFQADEPDRPRTRWKPSIHMPRRLSRITLKVTAVRIERLQNISEEDARAEGVKPDRLQECFANWGGVLYRKLWEELHGVLSWDRNPWVVVITFEVVKT